MTTAATDAWREPFERALYTLWGLFVLIVTLWLGLATPLQDDSVYMDSPHDPPGDPGFWRHLTHLLRQYGER